VEDESSATEKLSRNGLMGSAGIVFQDADKVNSVWLNARLMIAFHSPYVLPETGLRVCGPEKSRDNDPFSAEQSVLCSPVC
jgi:hypothetical protein